MTKTASRRVLMGLCAVSTIFTGLAVTAAAQTTTTEQIKGTQTQTTVKLHGVVTYVDGNTLVARMANGALRTFTIPDSRQFMIDGKALTVHDLKPGTSLTATVVTTTTPVTDRTVTNLTGTVWFRSGTTVILTLPDGKNKMYKSLPDYNFIVDGRKATVFQLQKGMKISAEKVVEQPTTEIATNATIVGHAPAPKPQPVVAQAPPPAPAPEPAPAPAPVEVAAAQPAPEPAPVEAPPAELPKTGSPLPLAGLAGLMLTGAGLSLRLLRRS